MFILSYVKCRLTECVIDCSSFLPALSFLFQQWNPQNHLWRKHRPKILLWHVSLFPGYVLYIGKINPKLIETCLRHFLIYTCMKDLILIRPKNKQNFFNFGIRTYQLSFIYDQQLQYWQKRTSSSSLIYGEALTKLSHTN